MKLPHSEPEICGSRRAKNAERLRILAAQASRLRPHALTKANGEENDHGPIYPANFTKGLMHDKNGLLVNAADYRCFVAGINSHDTTLFEKDIQTAESRCVSYNCAPLDDKGKPKDVKWRGWESPRAGHVYELEGPDAGSVAMAPAPRTGSSELAAEMAEVYSLALLRDVPFTTIVKGGGARLCASDTKAKNAELSAGDIVKALNTMPYFNCEAVSISSTPHNKDGSGLNGFERNRRIARTGSLATELSCANVFRGSTKGARTGPYVSQFLLIGTDSIAGGVKGGSSNCPGKEAKFGLEDGYIPYGALTIDQRVITHKNCLDHMTDWCTWLDVQNGANFGGADQFEAERRFITTPRDMATYVHYDQLYEAYLNACIIMLDMGIPHSKGFPEKSPSGNRTAFATYGGPHILSLVTEVATRCLKAVRRQKFNYHRRGRPEALGGRLTLTELGLGNRLGCADKAYTATLKEIPDNILKAIKHHNIKQNALKKVKDRGFECGSNCLPNIDDNAEIKEQINAKDFENSNLLLPMSFPEGSPMHPAYGAGHATVAGGCVTLLKAFFEMYDDCDSGKERELRDKDGKSIVYIPKDDGSKLIKDTGFRDEVHNNALTIQGELDKLAANISIGRNMAGVHYYSDYYDSLRMGERVAVGILMEQCPSYGEVIECTFKSFDGDHITITGEAESAASMSIIDSDGNTVDPRDWWLRHTVGEAFSEDL